MLCFVALIWDETDPIANRTAHELDTRFKARSPEWQTSISSAGITVHCRSTHGTPFLKATVLEDGSGVILGQVFKRDSEQSSAVSRFSAAVVKDFIATGA